MFCRFFSQCCFNLENAKEILSDKIDLLRHRLYPKQYAYTLLPLDAELASPKKETHEIEFNEQFLQQLEDLKTLVLRRRLEDLSYKVHHHMGNFEEFQNLSADYLKAEQEFLEWKLPPQK